MTILLLEYQSQMNMIKQQNIKSEGGKNNLLVESGVAKIDVKSC